MTDHVHHLLLTFSTEQLDLPSQEMIHMYMYITCMRYWKQVMEQKCMWHDQHVHYVHVHVGSGVRHSITTMHEQSIQEMLRKKGNATQQDNRKAGHTTQVRPKQSGCIRWDSNPQPAAFQSTLLPTKHVYVCVYSHRKACVYIFSVPKSCCFIAGLATTCHQSPGGVILPIQLPLHVHTHWYDTCKPYPQLKQETTSALCTWDTTPWKGSKHTYTTSLHSRLCPMAGCM